jgi:hypothetical protein
MENSFFYFVVTSQYAMIKMNIRHTITLGHQKFVRLKKKGSFGESYTELVSRILDQLDGIRDGQGELKIA